MHIFATFPAEPRLVVSQRCRGCSRTGAGGHLGGAVSPAREIWTVGAAGASH